MAKNKPLDKTAGSTVGRQQPSYTSRSHLHSFENVSTSADVSKDFTIETSFPDKVVRHNISDEQLTVLSSNKSDYMWEAMWASIGAFFGSIISTLTRINHAFWVDEKIPISFLGVVEIGLTSGAFILGIALIVFTHRRKSGPEQMAEEIRKRTRKKANA
jgi:hypothetical protein